MTSTPHRAQGRVDYLRLSITDRCNLRCTYCMPPDGVPPRAHGEILRYEELAAFTRVATTCGISKVRITGGEPLARLGCADFVRMLAHTSGIRDIPPTTSTELTLSAATRVFARDRLAVLVEDPSAVEDTSTIALAALALGLETGTNPFEVIV